MTSNLKFYISVTKELKLKIRNFGGLIPTFVEVMGEKLEGGPFYPPPPSIRNRVKTRDLRCRKMALLFKCDKIKNNLVVHAN